MPTMPRSSLALALALVAVLVLAAPAAVLEDGCAAAARGAAPGEEPEEAVLIQAPTQLQSEAGKHRRAAGARAPLDAGAAPSAESQQRQMRLHKMEDKGLGTDYGAVCLDGSPGAFYIAKNGSPEHANDWLILLEGGGWCTSPWDCFVARANATWPTSLGSSVGYEEVGQPWMTKGLNSLDCDISPFCNFTQVYVRYCDGTSYSGNLEDPVSVMTTDWQEIGKVYFRGQRIFDAVVDTLLQDFGLSEAKRVLFAGCSAGGLGATLHTDYMHERLKRGARKLEKFGSVPVSGFFLNRETTMGYPLYTSQMQQLFNLANWTTLNPECAAKLYPEVWKCNFAKVAYQFIKAPIFLINSALDWWQTRCILTSKLWDNGNCQPLEGYADCASNITKCASKHLPAMNGHMDDFIQDVKFAETFGRKGNGAFLDGCHFHCEGTEDHPFQNFKVNGVTMREAVHSWWKSDFAAEAAEHSHVEHCRYGMGAECNPTCTVFTSPFR